MNYRSMQWIVLALIVLPLAACGRQEADRQRAEAAATFREARAHLRRVQSGVIHKALAEPSGDASRALQEAGIEVPVSKEGDGSLQRYQQEQLEQAAKKLEPLTNSGSPAQRLAASRLIAETHASAARMLQRKATRAWMEQRSRLAALRSLASAIQRAHVSATAHGDVDRSEALGQLRSREESLTKEIAKLQDQIDQLQQRIDSKKQRIQQYEKKRRSKTQQADKLARRAFRAEGQAGYDLHKKASALQREADQLSAKAEKTQARLGVDRTRMRLLKTKLENKQARLAEVRSTIEELQKRQRGTDDLTQRRRQRVQSLAEEFRTKFEKLRSQQASRINEPFNTVQERLGQAIERLEKAVQAAPSASRTDAELSLAALRTEFGLALEEQAQIHAAYRDALQPLASGLEPALPEVAGSVSGAVEDADVRSAETSSRATELLKSSAKKLAGIADGAEPDVERSARRHLLQVHQALGRLEDASHKQAIETQQQRLNALQPGGGQSGGGSGGSPQQGGSGGGSQSGSQPASQPGSGSSGGGSATQVGGFTLDGRAADWQGVAPLVEEAGGAGSGRLNRVDVKQVRLTVADGHLLLFVHTNPTIAEHFDNRQSTLDLGGIAGVYFDTDNDPSTGCRGVDGNEYGSIDGFERRIFLSLGMKGGPGGERSYLLDCWINSVNDAGKFDGLSGPAIHERGLVADGPDGVELAVPLNLLGVQTGQQVRLLLEEAAHQMSAEGYNETTITL